MATAGKNLKKIVLPKKIKYAQEQFGHASKEVVLT